jgi:hypothetical protein
MKNRLNRALWLVFLPFMLNACSSKTHCSDHPSEPCTRILFIGNSYTYVNDLPGMFAQLARSGKHTVETRTLAPGGWSLTDHVKDKNTQPTIQSEKWDYVVLQEQSEIPAFEQSRETSMYPAARTLIRMIETNGSKPLLFMTWAHRDGDPVHGYADYDSMQNQIIAGYLTIAREQGIPAVPAGYAWWGVRKQYPEIALWQADGSHPDKNGTYLTACVFYAAIFRESPEGLAFTAHIPVATVRALQSVAARVVLDDPGAWNLGGE